MNNNEVREWVEYACECNGCPELVGRIVIRWSNRMTRSKGIARYTGIGENIRRMSITLSIPLFNRDDCEGNKRTVVHEACHLIDVYINNRKGDHGAGWRGCMRRAGIEPKRCHNVDTAGLANRWVYECPGCRAEFNVSTVMRNKIARGGRGSRRVCRTCRTVFDHDAYKGPALQQAAQSR